MLSVNEEKKLFKIFLYASVVSLALHTGIFIFVIQLGKTWGLIPMDESFFEVSIISMMEKTAGNGPADHPADIKEDKIQKKMVHNRSRTVQPQPDAKIEKTTEPNPTAPDANHLPGDTVPAESEMAMISNTPLSSGGSLSETGIKNPGYGGGESKTPGTEDGAGGLGLKMNYLNMVRFKIENQKKYPYSAQQRKIQGQVTVEFEISLDGRITEPSVSKSSGYPSLDLAAIDAVKKASPFESPPRQYFTDAIHINLPIRFELVR